MTLTGDRPQGQAAIHDTLLHAGIPQWFSLEISSHCNLKCPYCPTGNGQIPLSSRGNITDADFEKIFSEIRPHAEVIQLYNWGEPFFHKRLYHYIETISAAGIETQISSNLSVRLFDRDELERLVRSGLTSLLASIDGVTQEAYEAYRRGGKVEMARQNLANIQKTKARLGSQTPHLIWAYYLNAHNQHEIGAARWWAKKIGVQLWFKELSCPPEFQTSFLQERPWLFHTPEGMDKLWRGRRNSRVPQFTLDQRLPQVCGVCRMPFEMMIINYNGDVFPCTTVSGKDFVVGNLVRESLEEVWNRQMLPNRRQLLDISTRVEGAHCADCKHFPVKFPAEAAGASAPLPASDDTLAPA